MSLISLISIHPFIWSLPEPWSGGMKFFLLLFVAVLFSNSSSVSAQYFVSDNCSSVAYTPCRPLSVYAKNISHYSNAVFYFVGPSHINNTMTVDEVQNLTFKGMGPFSTISCSNYTEYAIEFDYSSDVNLFNVTFHECNMSMFLTDNVIIIGSVLSSLEVFYGFEVTIMSTVVNGLTDFYFNEFEPPACNDELEQYSLNLMNVSVFGAPLYIFLLHSMSYVVSVKLNNINAAEGIYIPLSDSYYDIHISNTSIHDIDYGLFLVHTNKVENSCDLSSDYSSQIIIEDCHFYDTSRTGVIINIIPETSKLITHVDILLKSCSISNNERFGLVLEVESSNINVYIEDTVLSGNERNLLFYTDDVYWSNVNITGARLTGLTMISSNLSINGTLIIRNNTGVNGGGIALYGESSINLLPEARLDITNNHATDKGGGIYFKNHIRCPLQDASNESALANIMNNTARSAGDDVYGYTIRTDSCPYLQDDNIKLSADPIFVCFCDPRNTSVDDKCNDSTPEQQIFPGQKVQFYVVMFGEAYSTEYSFTAGDIDISVDGRTVSETKSVAANCSSIEFTPRETDPTAHSARISVHVDFDQFQYYVQWNNIQLSFVVKPCPIGFTINSSSVCDCSQGVRGANVTCDIDTLTITHNSNQWIGTYDTGAPFDANETNPNACIINEDCLLYCSPNQITFAMNDTNAQCVDNRGQRMCGSCRDGYSLLMGSNKCGQCDNKDNYLIVLWIALFAVMGFLLVFVLIALNLTVSVGTLNGLLFYANIVKLYEPVFSRAGAVPVLHQIISWINLDFGIGACFYNGMDSYAKQWLQFAFPFYLWMIIIVIIWLCSKFGRIARLVGSNAVPVLSTLFLLSYTKLVRTIVIVLHSREVTLHCSNEPMRSVNLWYEDPNLEYGKGKHAVLFGFALFVLLFFILPYTLFLLLNPLIEKYLSNYKIFGKFWSQFKPIIDAYSGPMKDAYRFWPGLLLVARLPILLSVTLVDSFIESHYFLLCMLLTVLAALISLQVFFGGLYSKAIHDTVEVWFLFNLCLMASLSVALNGDKMTVAIWFNILVAVFTLSFIAMIVYHIHLQLLKKKWYTSFLMKRKQKMQPLEKQETFNNLSQEEAHEMTTITSTTIDMPKSLSHEDRRESVVDLFQ